MYEYRAKLDHIVDGDTYDLEIDLGLRIFSRARVRLAGVNTPETFGVKRGSAEWKRGDAAKRFVSAWFEEHGPKVRVRTHKDGSGKFGRWVVEVESVDGGSKLAEELVGAGHAERGDW